MFTEKQYLQFIPPKDLDDYLARGWYRLGQAIFTCQFLFFENSLYSAVWTRLPLKGYQFRKSLRKILKRNNKRFRIVIRPWQLDQEKEQLFQLYKKHFPGFKSPTLADYLLDEEEKNIYDSQEACIFDGDKLIAFSCFDIGEASIASIIGVYHPDYTAYSLGFFTMLLEINYGIERGFNFYYPGYIVPGNARFDYKLRIGKEEEVEFYNLKFRQWQNMSEFDKEELPVSVLTKKLGELQYLLYHKSIDSQLLFYPAYEAHLFGYKNKPMLESPLFLTCFNGLSSSIRFVIFFDLWREIYVFCSCFHMEDLAFYLDYSLQFESSKSKHFLDFLFKQQILIESPDPNVVVRKAMELQLLIKTKLGQMDSII